jgi:hypothetical protein
MELAEYFRDPASAALSAAAITALYIHFKAYINNEGKLELNNYAILVYFIVSNGIGQRETISMEPF